MTSELGPTARSLLDAARAGLSPDAAAIRRVRAGIDATLGATAATATTTTTAVTTTAKLGVLKLSLLASAVALVGVGAAVYLSRTPDTGQSARPAAVQPRTPDTGQAHQPRTADTGQVHQPRTPDTGQAHQPRMPDTGQAHQPRTPDTGQTRPGRTPDTGQATPGRTPDTGQAKPARTPDTGQAKQAQKRVELAREVELVDLAMASLRARDYEAALAAARQHARETGGRGQLAEDAAAIEIEAMCHLHQSVFTKLEAFDARWPSSAQRSRLTNSCR
jgi:hypothetical protein